MKVWEEDWYVDEDGNVSRRDGDSDKFVVAHPDKYEQNAEDRARLIAAAPKSVRLLEKYMFRAGGYESYPECIACGETIHEANCELAALLKTAGVLPP